MSGLRKSSRKSQPNSLFNNKDFVNPLTAKITLEGDKTEENSTDGNGPKTRAKNYASSRRSTCSPSTSLSVEKIEPPFEEAKKIVKVATPVAQNNFVTRSGRVTRASTRLSSNEFNNISPISLSKPLKEVKKEVKVEVIEIVDEIKATTSDPDPPPLKTDTRISEPMVQDDEVEEVSLGEVVRKQLLDKNIRFKPNPAEIEQFFKTTDVTSPPQIISQKPLIRPPPVIRKVVIKPQVPIVDSSVVNPGNFKRHNLRIPYYGLPGYTARKSIHDYTPRPSNISTTPPKTIFSQLKQGDGGRPVSKNEAIRQQLQKSSQIQSSTQQYRPIPRIINRLHFPSKAVPVKRPLEDAPIGNVAKKPMNGIKITKMVPETFENTEIKEEETCFRVPRSRSKAEKYTGVFSLPIKPVFEDERLSDVNPSLALKLQIAYKERRTKTTKEEEVRSTPFVPSRFAILENIVRDERKQSISSEPNESSGEITPIGEDTDNEEDLRKMVRVEYYGEICEIPQATPCRLCHTQMKLCNRKSRYKGELREYPAYRCLRKGCQTFRSVRKVLELDPLSPFYKPDAIEKQKAPSTRKHNSGKYNAGILKPYVPKPCELMEMPEELKLQYEEEEKLSKLNLEIRELLENDTLDLPQLQLSGKSPETEDEEEDEFVEWSELSLDYKTEADTCSSSSMSATGESQVDDNEAFEFQEVKKEEIL